MGPWAAQLGNYWSNRPAHIPFVKTLRSHWTHLQSKLSQKDCGLPSHGGLELDGGKGKFGSAHSRLKTFKFTKWTVPNFGASYIKEYLKYIDHFCWNFFYDQKNPVKNDQYIQATPCHELVIRNDNHTISFLFSFLFL